MEHMPLASQFEPHAHLFSAVRHYTYTHTRASEIIQQTMIYATFTNCAMCDAYKYKRVNCHNAFCNSHRDHNTKPKIKYTFSHKQICFGGIGTKT